MVAGTVSVCTGRALRISHSNTSEADSPGQASRSSTATAATDALLADTEPTGANGRAAAKLADRADAGRPEGSGTTGETGVTGVGVGSGLTGEAMTAEAEDTTGAMELEVAGARGSAKAQKE